MNKTESITTGRNHEKEMIDSYKDDLKRYELKIIYYQGKIDAIKSVLDAFAKIEERTQLTEQKQ